MSEIAAQIDEILQTLPAKEIVILAPPATRRSFPSIVDYGRLPEIPYKTLVGRDNELKLLDDAWTDQTTRVISLIAWGGAGKTSLVIEWLYARAQRCLSGRRRGAVLVLTTAKAHKSELRGRRGCSIGRSAS